MPKIVLHQFSFNRGEFDPTLQARSDIEWYSHGAAKVVNMFLRPGGGAVKRPGFRFVDHAFSDDADKPSRLVPFVFSVEQSYILEFSDYKIRVLMDGALVLYPPGHPKAGQPVEIETGYAAEVIDDLAIRTFNFDYAQTADVMYITHRLHPLARLVRFKDDQYEYDHHNWRLETVAFGSKIAAPSGLALTKRGNDGSIYVVTAVNEDGEESTVSNATGENTPSGTPWPVPDYDSLNIDQCRHLWVTEYSQTWPDEWDVWKHIAVWENAHYFLLKVLGYRNGSSSTEGKVTRRYMTRPNGVEVRYREDNGRLSEWFAEVIYGINMGWGGVLGTMRKRIQELVEQHNGATVVTGHSTLSWSPVLGEDDAEENDPAEKDGEQDGDEDSGGEDNGRLKPAIGYRVYRSHDGGSAFRMIGYNDGVDNTTFDDNNLDYDPSGATPPLKDMPFEGVGNYPAVVRFFEQRLLLGRTDNEPNTFWGSQTNNYHNFDRSTINPTPDQSYKFTMMASEMNEIMFIDAVGSLLIGTTGGEFRAGANGAITASNPPSIRPQSNFGAAKVRPVVAGNGLLFVPRSRTAVRNLAYSLESDGFMGEDITLWAKHLFRNRRIVTATWQKDPDHTLWAVTSDGRLFACIYMPEQSVQGWSRIETDGRVESVASLVEADGTETVYATVVREINGRPRRLIELLAEPFENLYDPDDPASIAHGFFVDSGLSYEGEPVDSVSGLDHLENRQVAILADGFEVKGQTVRNGTVELPLKASVIHVGLPYRWELETLDLDAPDPTQSLRMRRCQVVRAWIRFYQCRECFYAADSVSHRFEHSFRTVDPGQPFPAFTGDAQLELCASADGEPMSRLYMTGSSPVPAGVLAVRAEISYGD